MSEAPEKTPGNSERTPKGVARALGSRVSRSWQALLWEQLWPPFAAALAVVGFFLAVSWAGLWVSVPPLARIAGADCRDLGQGHGEIALRLDGKGRIAWAMLWPHVRPWRLKHPEPMLRAIADAEMVARLLHRCCAALVDIEASAAEAAPKSQRRPRKARPIAAEPAGVNA